MSGALGDISSDLMTRNRNRSTPFNILSNSTTEILGEQASTTISLIIVIFCSLLWFVFLLTIIRYSTGYYLSRRILHLRLTDPFGADVEIMRLRRWKNTSKMFPIWRLVYVIYHIGKRLSLASRLVVLDVVGKLHLLFGVLMAMVWTKEKPKTGGHGETVIELVNRRGDQRSPMS